MKSNSIGKKSNLVLGEDTGYQVRLLCASFRIRVFNTLIGLIFAAVIRNVIGINIPRQVFWVLGAALFTSIVYMLVFRSGVCKTRRHADNVHFSYYFPGISYATLLIYYLGGLGWIAGFFYCFDLIYANVLLRRSRGALITAFMGICYFALLMLQYKGVIPQQQTYSLTGMIQGDFGGIFIRNMIAAGVLLVLVSYSTGLFSKMKEDRENSLLESRNRFKAKSGQLEEITRTLRKNAAENKYLKSAAMGYIEKKEFELETVKKDLEDQIEKLRKTQKSMVFMIEDLNEMSAQLKDARDNLEEKVRERTDELLDISQKLHRSERLAFLGKLAGSVTHELRNPLAVLKNAAYFLGKRFKDKKDEKVLKYIGMIEKEISLIDSIVDDIMGFARTRAPELERTDLKDVIESAISAIKMPELVKVVKDFQKLPKISIDRDQAVHALVNIANNAIVAMNGNGTLTFRTLKKDDGVCIEIEDTGPGIPPDQRELIFEPLYSSRPKGTGLGLPIAKMMVENQEGRIEFDSKPGTGTVFKIFLPVRRTSR